MRWAGNVAHTGERRGACRVLVGKPEGKRPLGRPRCRWKNTLVIHFQEVGWGRGLNLSGSGQGQLAGSCGCGNEPPSSIICGGCTVVISHWNWDGFRCFLDSISATWQLRLAFDNLTLITEVFK